MSRLEFSLKSFSLTRNLKIHQIFQFRFIEIIFESDFNNKHIRQCNGACKFDLFLIFQLARTKMESNPSKEPNQIMTCVHVLKTLYVDLIFEFTARPRILFFFVSKLSTYKIFTRVISCSNPSQSGQIFEILVKIYRILYAATWTWNSKFEIP